MLQRLLDTNHEILPGYGEDPHCRAAREKIRAACDAPNADVFFMTGGTQANQVVIDAVLRCHEGVIAASSGHINTHEAGAVERNGHKILALAHDDGKLRGSELEGYLLKFYNDPNRVQMVYPGMVYLSYPTEYGTLYTKDELKRISRICQHYHLFLYIDGARLGYGLAAPDADMGLSDIASLCDAFYFGGTKIGAICGEAVIFPKGGAPRHFSTIMRQHGALLAKGRLLGVQFEALFSDDLYLQICANAIEQATRLKALFLSRGYTLLSRPQTNQLFVLLSSGVRERLEKEVLFRFWERYDEKHIVARFVTSWATKDGDIGRLGDILPEIAPDERNKRRSR